MRLQGGVQTVPPAAESVLSLAMAAMALPGGGATGASLLESLVAPAPAAWLGAALQCALAARGNAEGRDAVLGVLVRQPMDMLPTDVVLDALIQVRRDRVQS